MSEKNEVYKEIDDEQLSNVSGGSIGGSELNTIQQQKYNLACEYIKKLVNENNAIIATEKNYVISSCKNKYKSYLLSEITENETRLFFSQYNLNFDDIKNYTNQK